MGNTAHCFGRIRSNRNDMVRPYPRQVRRTKQC
nr:MAG TPA: hypothetical protein [Caudoviricetes sp.]